MRKPLIALIAIALFSGTNAQAMSDDTRSQQLLLLEQQYRFDKKIVLPADISVPQIASFPRDLRVGGKKIAKTPEVRKGYVVKNVALQLPLVQSRIAKALPAVRGELVIHASAYTAAADETGSGNGITASGARVRQNHTIACPAQYRFGTKVKIEGYGTYTCEDRGGAIRGNRFDIYMETKSEAFAFGRRRLVAHVTP